jgi:hypothetical protein
MFVVAGGSEFLHKTQFYPTMTSQPLTSYRHPQNTIWHNKAHIKLSKSRFSFSIIRLSSNFFSNTYICIFKLRTYKTINMPRNGDGSSDNGPIEGQNIIHGASGDVCGLLQWMPLEQILMKL